MSMKKKYLATIRSFSGLGSHFHAHDYLWEKLSKSFDKIFVINDDNLKYFPFLTQDWIEKNYDFKKIREFAPKNVELINPSNIQDFDNFVSDKELLIINQFRRLFPDLKTHLLIKKHNFKQIQITNFGHGTGMSQHVSIKSPLKALGWYLKIFSKKLTLILSWLGFINQMEIRFISDKKIIDNINKSKFKKFLYNKKLFFSKELVLVNSRNYDILNDRREKSSEEYIVHLNANLNYWQEVELRGKLDEKKISNHYRYLEKFLNNLSSQYNKKIIICLHPAYDLFETDKYLKNFEVVKYRTREFIYKAFLVTNFDSSAITDAVLLKKRIIGLISNHMTKNEVEHSKSQADRCGYLTINFQNEYDFDKKKLLKKLDDQIPEYEKKIISNLCIEPDVNGTKKMIRIIKDRFF